MKKIIVLVALPGSGKTTYAKSIQNNISKLYDVDLLLQKKNATLNDLLLKVGKDLSRKTEVIILDGLFLTKEKQISIVHHFKDTPIQIEFHYWHVDREACLWNDKYRREEKAEITINKSIVNEPNYQELVQINPNVLEVVYHQVIRKSAYEVFKAKYGLEDEVKSDSWTIAATSRDSDDEWTESEFLLDDPIDNFDKFDDLIEKIVPEILYIHCKKLYKASVQLIEFEQGDIYTHTTNKQYVCDTKSLFDFLVEKNYINPNQM